MDVWRRVRIPARRLESVPDDDPCATERRHGQRPHVPALGRLRRLRRRLRVRPGTGQARLSRTRLVRTLVRARRARADGVVGPPARHLRDDVPPAPRHRRYLPVRRLVDLPGAGGPRRILEGSLDFDASARDIGLRSATFAAPTPVPHLVFNTSADDVRERVELSTLQLEPRAGVVADGLDAHCTEGDLPLVTAAVLSARFPVVTSAGRIACAHRSVVDGGYLENTGVAAIAEVLPRLTAAVQKQNTANEAAGRPPIRIVVVEISNGPRGRGRRCGAWASARRAEAALRAARPAVAAELPDRGRSRRARAGRGRRLRGGRRHRPRHGAAAARGRLEGVGRLAALARRTRRAGVGPRRGRTADQPGNGRRAARSVVRERRACPLLPS